MTVANKLSLLRILLVPVCMVFLLIPSIPAHYILALVFFIIAAVTDIIDGRIARRSSTVTTFGKFIDPLADKMLVCSVLICLVRLGAASAAAVVIIVFREFAISGLRLMASQSGKVLAANMWGKTKTFVTMVIISIVIFLLELCEAGLLGAESTVLFWCRIGIWACAVLTVVSVISYFADNRDCLRS